MVVMASGVGSSQSSSRPRWPSGPRPSSGPLLGALLLVLAIAAGCGGGATPAPTTGTSAVTATSAAASTSPPAASPSSSPAAGGDLAGTWSGQYSGAFQGTFTLTWTQSGSKLTGTIDLSSLGGEVPINGTVNGNDISFGTVGSTEITYTGSVSGDSMSGQYEVHGQGEGSWSATKTS